MKKKLQHYVVYTSADLITERPTDPEWQSLTLCGNQVFLGIFSGNDVMEVVKSAIDEIESLFCKPVNETSLIGSEKEKFNALLVLMSGVYVWNPNENNGNPLYVDVSPFKLK